MTMGDYWLSTKRLKCVLTILVFILYFGFLTAQESNTEPAVSCPPNEIFRPCLVDCMNCDFRGYCPLNCNRSGCDCIANFYRLEPDGPCEPVQKCPKFECGENEVFRDCGPVCERCNTYLCRIVACDKRCYCKEGYLRDANWTCVPQDQCPQKTACADVEELAESGKIYEYCLYADTETVTNDTRDQLDCYCKEGYKRNGMGYCVEEQYCHYVHCVETEEYNACTPKCNSTCWNYGDPDCTEDGECYPGCFCKPGTVMNDFRACVPLDQCPPGSNPFAPTAPPPSEEESTEAPPATSASPKEADTEATTEEDDVTTEAEEETTTVTEAETEETTETEAETTETTVEEEETTTQPPPKVKNSKPTKDLKSKLSRKALAAEEARAKAKAAAAAEA